MWLQLIPAIVDTLLVYTWTAFTIINLTCLLVAWCLTTVSLICFTSALVIPPITNNIIQSLLAGRGRAELINKLFIDI